MAPSPRSRRVTLLALGALSSFGPLSMDLYLPALPRVALDFGASDGVTQLSLSGCLVGLAVGQLLAGPLSDRWGRRRPLLISVALWALMSLACALAPSVWVLVAARVAQGLAGAGGLAIARAVVRDLFEGREVVRAFAVLTLVSGIAPVVAPLLGSQLLRVISWRGLFLVLAGVGVLLVWSAWWALPESLAPPNRRSGGLRGILTAFRDVSGDRIFVGGAGVLALGGAVLFTYISLSTFVLQQQFGLSPAEFGLVFAGNSVGLMLAGLTTARALRRTPPVRVLGAGLTVMLCAVILLAVAVLLHLPLVLVLVPLFFAIASVGAVFPTSTGIALIGHARNAGTASALLGAGQYLVGAVAGPLVSLNGASASAMSLGMLGAGSGAMIIYCAVVLTRAAGRGPSAARLAVAQSTALPGDAGLPGDTALSGDTALPGELG